LATRNQVFVSYSHADSEHLQRLRVHLRPYERESRLALWDDTKIRTGDRWRNEIEAAMGRAAVAILLVSADFLASDFIAENELPPLLGAAAAEGVRILPVIVKPCAFGSMKSLFEFQAANDPNAPLISLSEAERESTWARVAQDAEAAIREFEAKATEAAKYDPYDDIVFGDFGWSVELIGGEIRDPKMIGGFDVYTYHHIDVLEYMPLASGVLADIANRDEVLEAVARRFREAGWEGDGDIRIMWVPPFAGAGSEDTYGVAVWFVKQDNNGTSYLASPVPLPFPRLLEQQY